MSTPLLELAARDPLPDPLGRPRLPLASDATSLSLLGAGTATPGAADAASPDLVRGVPGCSTGVLFPLPGATLSCSECILIFWSLSSTSFVLLGKRGSATRSSAPRHSVYLVPESNTVPSFPPLSPFDASFASQRDAAKRQALLHEIEIIYAEIQTANRTPWVEAAERRLARLRLRSSWTALNLARLSSDKSQATRKRDAAIEKAAEIKANILLHAQRRSQEKPQVCGPCLRCC